MTEKVYMLVNINIEDKETYLNYEKGFFPILKKHGGEFITFDDKVEHLEGKNPIAGRTILWTFRSEESAKAWYNDPEYQELAKIRRSSTVLNNLSIIKSLPKISNLYLYQLSNNFNNKLLIVVATISSRLLVSKLKISKTYLSGLKIIALHLYLSQ